MSSGQTQLTIDAPQSDDAACLARLFKEDMDDLGVETKLEELEEVADAVIDGMAQRPRRCLCWVARSGEVGEVVGVVLANFNWSLKFAGRSLWIETLYVTPSARRRGLGAELVEHLLDWAEAHEIKGIDLEAYQGNTPASILYRSFGFERLGRERFYFRLQGSGYL